MKLVALVMVQNIHQLVAKADRQKRTDPRNHDNRPIGPWVGQNGVKQPGNRCRFIGLGEQGQREQVDCDRQCPDNDFRQEHADAEQQTQREIQQETGIGNRRAKHEKRPGQQPGRRAGSEVVRPGKIADIGHKDRAEQQELENDLPPRRWLRRCIGRRHVTPTAPSRRRQPCQNPSARHVSPSGPP